MGTNKASYIRAALGHSAPVAEIFLTSLFGLWKGTRSLTHTFQEEVKKTSPNRLLLRERGSFSGQGRRTATFALSQCFLHYVTNRALVILSFRDKIGSLLDHGLKACTACLELISILHIESLKLRKLQLPKNWNVFKLRHHVDPAKFLFRKRNEDKQQERCFIADFNR